MTPLRRSTLSLGLFVGFSALMLWAPSAAFAQVACAAVLNTDTTLTASDPVVFDPVAQPGDTACAGHGLNLRGPMTLDCAGLTIKGRGAGSGLRVLSGEGVVIQNCNVDGFSIGISFGAGDFHSIEGGSVINNRTTGVSVAVDGNSLTGVLAFKNGGAGFLIRGSGNSLTQTVALENGSDGYSISGKEHVFTSNVALSNAGDGFDGTGRLTSFSSNIAVQNKLDGLQFGGGTLNEPNDYSGNIAVKNGANGINVAGTNPDINIDAGGNKGIVNGGPKQCSIAGQPCQP